MSAQIKRCPKCGDGKPLSAFDTYFDNSRQRRRPQSYCRGCMLPSARARSAAYYTANKGERLQYAKQYREQNKPVLAQKKAVYRKKYRAELQDCVVVEILTGKTGLTPQQVRQVPELIEAQRTLIKIKRTLKNIKNEKQTNRPQ